MRIRIMIIIEDINIFNCKLVYNFIYFDYMKYYIIFCICICICICICTCIFIVFWSSYKYNTNTNTNANANANMINLINQPHITKILDYLYLGDGQCSRDCAQLNSLGINSIINMAPVSEPNQCKFDRYLEIDINDSVDVSIDKYFAQTYDFIESARLRGNKVLVHCRAGISRSASIVIAYLMRKFKWDYDASLYYVKDRRPIINPNRGFRSQLIAFEKTMHHQ